MEKSEIKPGDVILCVYVDAVLFHDLTRKPEAPSIRRVIGRLDHLDEHFVRIVFEEAYPRGGETRFSGLLIPRENILELRRIGRVA